MKLIIRSPINDEVVGRVPVTPLAEVAGLIEQCRQAQAKWAQLDPRERSRRLKALRHVIAESRDEIVDLIVKENGKPAFEALAAEVMPSLDFLAHFENQTPKLLRPKALKLGTRLLPHRQSWIEYAPLGVIAIISPWNFPWLLPFCEIVVALLAGNGVILKPSEVTPLTGLKIREMCDRAGIPPGLVTVATGDGTVGAEIVRSGPDKIFFTGSVATGKKIMALASEQLIPVNLELGGKDAMIVCADADLDLASSAAVWGSNFNLGQACASVERIIVAESIAKEFTTLVIEKIGRLTSSDLGSVTFAKQKLIYDSQLEEARSADASILIGGTWSRDKRTLAPTIVAGQSVESLQIYKEETFGPIAALTTFSDENEAVRKANDSPYGLTASVFSRNLSTARAIASRIEAGTITINEVLYTAGIPGTPWGGWKNSGIGRTHHNDGVYDFVELRHIHAPKAHVKLFKSFWWFPYSRYQRLAFESLSDRHKPGLTAKLRAWLGVGVNLVKMLKSEPRL